MRITAQKRPNMRKSTSDIWAGLGFLAVALAFGVQYDSLVGVSRVFPETLISFIALGGIWFVGKGLWRRRSEDKKAGEEGEHTSWRRVAIITLFALCYAAAISTLGFFSSTGLFLFLAFLFLDASDRDFGTRIFHGLIFSIVFSLLIWVGFSKLLNVPTPEGLLF